MLIKYLNEIDSALNSFVNIDKYYTGTNKRFEVAVAYSLRQPML